MFKGRRLASSCFFFPSFLFRLFERYYRGGYKYTGLISDPCFPSHTLCPH